MIVCIGVLKLNFDTLKGSEKKTYIAKKKRKKSAVCHLQKKNQRLRYMTTMYSYANRDTCPGSFNHVIKYNFLTFLSVTCPFSTLRFSYIMSAAVWITLIKALKVLKIQICKSCLLVCLSLAAGTTNNWRRDYWHRDVSRHLSHMMYCVSSEASPFCLLHFQLG